MGGRGTNLFLTLTKYMDIHAKNSNTARQGYVLIINLFKFTDIWIYRRYNQYYKGVLCREALEGMPQL